MVEIKKCSICEPSFSCVSNGDGGRLYYFQRANEYHSEPESIYDCPVFRGKVSVEESVREKMEHTEKSVSAKNAQLINQKTGEEYPYGL